jgi:hypothetical protein
MMRPEEKRGYDEHMHASREETGAQGTEPPPLFGWPHFQKRVTLSFHHNSDTLPQEEHDPAAETWRDEFPGAQV